MERSVRQSAFQNLKIWQSGMAVARQTYRIAAKLPREEQFGLASQMRRSAVSIPSNIAEGAKRGKKEFSQFLKIANGSAAELETQLLLAESLYSIDSNETLRELGVLQRMIESLLKKL